METTLRKLEFDGIRDAVAACCASSLGKRLAAALTPAVKPHVVCDWLAQVREMTSAAREHGFPPFGGVHDIRDEVRAAGFPTPLEAETLARIAETLQATAALQQWFVSLSEDWPGLKALGSRIDNLSSIAAAIHEAIDERGQVRDYASPRLASIRGTIESARARIKVTFDRLLRQTSLLKMLQYGGATFHEDRMVLPLKSEHRGRIPGIVHRSSDSGSTLFVEPAESVELNNTIVRLRDDESKEITQILRGLTQRVHLNATAIQATLRAMSVLDLIAGKVRYAHKRACICPEITEKTIDLRNARHPLLLELFDQQEQADGTKRAVVPITIRLGDDFDILVITGPNTGGKTVTLKTVGLFAVMTQCGIPIPAAEGSRMPVFDQIHIDVGDEQSLQQSLSTFSSHLQNLLHILKHSGPRSLVLIDELGAGTDPDEGAAIGRAIVAELLDLKSLAIVTTHLSSLKAVAFTTPRVDNAAVEFDTETLRPTYHVLLGEPGNSNALIIAKRLGMSARLVKMAKGFLDGRARELSRAIAGTVDLRREAEVARQAANAAVLQAVKQREQYEKERNELLRTQQEYDRWAAWINRLQPGENVYIRSLARNARVVRVQLHKQTALLFTGKMDIEVGLKDIEEAREL